MSRVVAALVGALALAGCSSWMPSLNLDFMSGGGGGAELSLDSDPPGADARTSTGQGCRTPCAVVVPAADQSVTFTLAGFIPISVPVRVRLPTDPRADPNAAVGVQFEPNPVAVVLEQAPPPAPARRKPAAKRRPPPPPPPRQ